MPPPVTKIAQSCAGCLQNVPGREFLTCMLCKNIYDLECANVSNKRFYNTMTPEQKNAWKCQSCRCKMPKTDNSNTPARPRDQDLAPQTSGKNNVTIRNKRNAPSCSTFLNDSISSNESSILGDTICQESQIRTDKPNIKFPLSKSTNKIEEIETLLDKRLSEIKQSLLHDLKTIIFSEISNSTSTLKTEILEITNTLYTEHNMLKQRLNKINNTLVSLEAENVKLHNQIKILNKRIDDLNTNSTPENIYTKEYESNKENCKKIVLHGLDEYYWETEDELHNQIVNIFGEIMNINLAGYIEDLTRIGRKTNRRPLVIELLSKKMTKYLLRNKHIFRNTGLSISEFLDEDSIKIRRLLRPILLEARENGHHAVFSYNKLLINGKEYKQPCKPIIKELEDTTQKLPAQSLSHVDQNSTVSLTQTSLQNYSSSSRNKDLLNLNKTNISATDSFRQ